MESFSWIPVRSKKCKSSFSSPCIFVCVCVCVCVCVLLARHQQKHWIPNWRSAWMCRNKTPTSDPPGKGRRHQSPFCVRLTCLQTKPINQPADFIKVEPATLSHTPHSQEATWISKPTAQAAATRWPAGIFRETCPLYKTVQFGK